MKKNIKSNKGSLAPSDYLVIVESPSKTKKIEQYLNQVPLGSFKVIASKGHIRQVDGLKSIDTKKNFHVNYSFIKTKKDHVENMRAIIDTYPKDRVIIATDNDREGEGIAFHLCEVFHLPLQTTKRILFNEITADAIREAITNPTTIRMDLVRSQVARQIVDVLIGFKISPLLWKYVYSSKSKSLSAGRCQTPALRLVYDNHKEGLECVPKMKYNTFGNFFQNLSLRCKLNHEFKTEEDVLKFLQASIGFKYEFHGFKGEPKTSVRQPPAPLNTSRLLQSANSYLHMSPKICMDTAQKLYQEGLITYHRTESKKYCKDFLNKITEFIQNLYHDPSYLNSSMNLISNEHDSLPHEAIRVTDLSRRTIDGDPKMVSLYRYIWNNTVESCMSASILEVYQVEINAAFGYKFTYTLEIPRFYGWMRLQGGSDLGNKERGILLSLQSRKDKTVECISIESNMDITGFHQHYTESSLIQKLEDLGIGRPSTYAMFVETIQERGYVKKTDIEGIKHTCNNFRLDGSKETLEKNQVEKIFGKESKKLKIEPLGILCIEFLIQQFSNIFNYSYTKNIEEQLDKIVDISTGENAWYSICNEVLIEIQSRIKGLQDVQKMTFPLDETHDLVFQSFGPCVRRTLGKNKYEYLPLKPSVNIDVDSLLENGIESLGINSIQEIVVYFNSYLGKYDVTGESVNIKTGTYGHYLECGNIQKSLKDFPVELIEHITLERAIGILFGPKTEEEKQNEYNDKKILRSLTPQMNIRKGRFGTYVYYLPPDKKDPYFISLKKFKEDYFTCDENTLISWVLSECEAKDNGISSGRSGGRGRGRGRGGGGRGGRGRARGECLVNINQDDDSDQEINGINHVDKLFKMDKLDMLMNT